MSRSFVKDGAKNDGVDSLPDCPISDAQERISWITPVAKVLLFAEVGDGGQLPRGAAEVLAIDASS